MFVTSLNAATTETMDVSAFEATPGLNLIVLAEPPAYIIKAVSNDCVSAVGLPREQLVGQNYFDVFCFGQADSTDRQTLLASFAYSAAHNQVDRLVLSHFPIAGAGEPLKNQRWEICNTPLPGEDEQVLYIIHTLVKQTELKIAQQSLQKEINFSSRLLEASLNGICVLSAVRQPDGSIIDFTCLQANQKFAEFTGHQLQDSIGQSFLSLFSTSLESGFFGLLCQVINTGKMHRQSMHYAKSLNRWYEYVAVQLEADSVVVTFQEISQQRESARQLERQKTLLDNILSHSPSGISVYTTVRDKEGRITDFQCIVSNKAAELFTQITTAERLAKTVLEITPGVKGSALFQMAVSAVETGKSFRTQYYHAPIDRWLELAVVKMDDDHLINVFTDITSTKQAQMQLEQSIQELQRSNEELQQFAYVASHDLQEPLRKIRVFNNIISEKLELSSPLHPYIEKVENSAVRMSGLIKSLLDYARLSKNNLRFEQVDLNVILQNVLSDYELLINQKNAVIHSEELPVLEAIPLQMNQLFFNLIGNALKFIRKGVQPQIRIQARPLSAERKKTFTQLQSHRDFLELIIQDNGIGFNQEYASKIFTIFQRLNERSLFDGYGIGLALCKKVADTHSGIIYAEGKPKEGASFTILLPYRQG